MRNIVLIAALLLVVVCLWYFTLYSQLKGVSSIQPETILTEVNNWFSMLALVCALFALCVLVLNMQSQTKQFNQLLEQNRNSLEVIALASLIQESDATLHRYDRWEAAGIKGDYVNAKSTVREKMNSQREKLEQKYYEITGHDYSQTQYEV